MSATPTPATPSEGAGFYRWGNVPEGWEYRWSVVGEHGEFEGDVARACRKAVKADR